MSSKKIFALFILVLAASACHTKVGKESLSSTSEAHIQKDEQNTIYFAFDSSELSTASKERLDNQADWLNKNSAARVKIEGHCDQRGTEAYNYALGKRRAVAAKNYLISKGVKASRIKVVSYGKSRPAVDENNEEAWAKNRRVIVVK